MWRKLLKNSQRWLMAIVISMITGGLSATYAQAQPMEQLPIILAIGESTTAGFGVGSADSYPSQLQRLLDDNGYAWRVVNHGRSGSTTAMALSGLDRGLLLNPDIVIIALGGNDQGSVAAARTKENLRKLVSMFVRTDALVLLADRNGASDRTNAETASLYAELAKEEGATLMPSLREGIAGQPELLLSDGSHPNAAGYAIVASRIFSIIEPHLQSRSINR